MVSPVLTLCVSFIVMLERWDVLPSEHLSTMYFLSLTRLTQLIDITFSKLTPNTKLFISLVDIQLL